MSCCRSTRMELRIKMKEVSCYLVKFPCSMHAPPKSMSIWRFLTLMKQNLQDCRPELRQLEQYARPRYEHALCSTKMQCILPTSKRSTTRLCQAASENAVCYCRVGFPTAQDERCSGMARVDAHQRHPIQLLRNQPHASVWWAHLSCLSYQSASPVKCMHVHDCTFETTQIAYGLTRNSTNTAWTYSGLARIALSVHL